MDELLGASHNIWGSSTKETDEIDGNQVFYSGAYPPMLVLLRKKHVKWSRDASKLGLQGPITMPGQLLPSVCAEATVRVVVDPSSTGTLSLSSPHFTANKQ